MSLRQLPRSFKNQSAKRFYSTSPSQSTEQLQKKAAEYAAVAQNNLVKFWGVAKKSLGPLGERLGGALGCEFGFVSQSYEVLTTRIAYRAPLTYNFHVTRELLKQVYAAERLQPPHWTTVVNTYSTLWSRVRNPAYLRDLVSSGDWMKVGVYAVEGYGIFKVRHGQGIETRC